MLRLRLLTLRRKLCLQPTSLGSRLTPHSKIWDTHTGEPLFTIQHNHIVRAIAYPSDNSDLIATGGAEKKLRVFDLTEVPNPALNGNTGGATIQASDGFEIGEGTHKAPIKFVAWTKDPNTIVTASDNTLRWFDLPTRSCTRHEVLDGEIKSCELVSLAPKLTSPDDIGGGHPVLAVAAGKWVYFWGGPHAMDEIKRMELKYTVASVGLDLKGRKLVVGEEPGTWARVINWDNGEEIGKSDPPLFRLSARRTDRHRNAQGPPRAHLVHRLLARRQALRDGLRGRHHQDVEELRGLLRAVARRRERGAGRGLEGHARQRKRLDPGQRHLHALALARARVPSAAPRGRVRGGQCPWQRVAREAARGPFAGRVDGEHAAQQRLRGGRPGQVGRQGPGRGEGRGHREGCQEPADGAVLEEWRRGRGRGGENPGTESACQAALAGGMAYGSAFWFLLVPLFRVRFCGPLCFYDGMVCTRLSESVGPGGEGQNVMVRRVAKAGQGIRSSRR